MKNRILAHRGFWLEPAEKNSPEALRRALAGGFGIETDIRDLDGELVISHDPPRIDISPMPFSAFLDLYCSLDSQGWLALNIKADGLAGAVTESLARSGVKNAFVFDMSVPDMRGYLAAGAVTFTRRSDVETEPAYYDASHGVWLDCFDIPYSPSRWAIKAVEDCKHAALVSPELHGREYRSAWSDWHAAFSFHDESKVMICTDLPTVALDYFQSAR